MRENPAFILSPKSSPPLGLGVACMIHLLHKLGGVVNEQDCNIVATSPSMGFL